MKKRTSFLLFALASVIFTSLKAQNAKEKGLQAITKQAVQGQLEFLSSDWTEGRHTGRPGAYMAADYITSLFKVYGLEPGGDMARTQISRAERRNGKRPTRYRSFYQNFKLIEYKPGDNQELSIVNNSRNGSYRLNLDYKTDFSVWASDIAVDIEAPIVFVGYGYENEEVKYNDYKGVDVNGKIILRLTGYPGHMDTSSQAFKKIGEKKYWQLRNGKSELAKKAGVIAIIDISPGNDPLNWWPDNIPFRYNSGNYEGDKKRTSYYDDRMKLPGDKLSESIPSIRMSERSLNELLKDTKIDLEKFEEQVKNNLKPASKELKTKKIHLKTTVESRIIEARNVIGVIPGKDTSEIIVVGGHYDHLGKHDGWIWNGADDNASGTVGVMTMAKAFMASGEQPEKTIVFAAWTGEEKGLFGSKYFVDHPYNDSKVILNLNYDMISRDNKDDTLGIKCQLNYTKKYPILEELSEKNNDDYSLGLDIKFKPSKRPGGGSDHSSFSNKDIPIIYFMAGFPQEYHQPEDHINLVNFDKLVNIIKIGYLTIWDLGNSEWQNQTDKKSTDEKP